MTDEQEYLFGCGYFNDAADLPGQETLIFLLKGEIVNFDKEMKRKQIKFNKIYDKDICPYCGIKIEKNQESVRWHTSQIAKLIEKRDFVFSICFDFR